MADFHHTQFFSGCGDKDGATSSTPTPTASASPASIGSALTAAVGNGTLPTLDTSASITGTDVNANGVRDDIDTYINSLSDATAAKAALLQHAAAIQASLTVNTSDANALAAQAQRISAAVQCVFAQYAEAVAPVKAETIEKYTVNTKERFLAYANYNSALSGSVTLSVEGTGCV